MEEGVGTILLKVQDEISRLREQVENGKSTDSVQITEALRKAELDLQKRSEDVLKQIDNRVKTVPSLQEQLDSFHSRFPLDYQSPLEQDVRNDDVYVSNLSPGEQWKQLQAFRALADPHNVNNRQMVQERYGITLPQIKQKMVNRQPEKIARGSTIDKLATIPSKKSETISQVISEKDTKKGILSLIERGIIPPAAQIVLDPNPVKHRLAPVHDTSTKMRDKFPADTSDPGYTHGSYKIDATTSSGQHALLPKSKEQTPQKSLKTKSSVRQINVPLQITNIETEETTTNEAEKRVSVVPPPPTTPASQLASRLANNTTTRIAFQNGKIKQETNDYKIFKQRYSLDWGTIVSMIKIMENFLKKYSVPVAFVIGESLVDLAFEYEVEGKPTEQELIECIVNKDDIIKLLQTPGRQFLGDSGTEIAVTRIQSTWRGYQARQEYKEYKKKKWAAGIIAIEWILHLKLLNVKNQLKATRSKQLDGYRKRWKLLETNWDNWRNKKRVIIHLPSYGYSQKIRDNTEHLNKLQNSQMSRLCDIRDPNVDVILISPVPIADELIQYYEKLTSLKPAIDSGNLEDQKGMSERYKIIVPEAIKSFPSHNMCLSTLLKYSPRALRRIRNLIKGRIAYIVPGYPCADDIAVADKLEVPILCPEPEVTHLYGTKSGSKRIFQSADIPIPPSDFDIYSMGQLQECLAQLITENLSVKRWLLKLDTEFNGRGIGFVDIEHLPCYEWALKERQRFGDKWGKKWAQEKVYIKIYEEIPEFLKKGKVSINGPYQKWKYFMEDFLAHGGIVEATPPAESITNLTVDLCVEPTGNIKIISCGDHLKDAEQPFYCTGTSFPQCSVDPAILNNLCAAIGDACWKRKIVGHFSVDFVTFMDASNEQVIWATDLSLHYSNSAAMTQLILFATNGKFNPIDHELTVAMSPAEEEAMKKRDRQTGLNIVVKGRSRYAVTSSNLYHTNLSAVHYSVFFQTCRAQGIGFDVTDKTGTLFTLVDSFQRDFIGMATISDDLQSALQTFARNLNVINQEISTYKMQGKTNFNGILRDLSEVIDITSENTENMKTD